MTGEEFAGLLNEFTLSAESGDGARFAGHFTEDAIYYDYIYGAHKGRADIAHMMQNLFHRCRHRSAARAVLRPALCRRQHRLHNSVLAALRCAVPDFGRSHHRRQPGDGGGAAQQRFSRRRREFSGETSAAVYGEVSGAGVAIRLSWLPRPVFALAGYAGHVSLRLSWLRHA